MYCSLAHALHQALCQEPDKEAFILVGPSGEQRATRAEVDADARYTAHRLLANGIQPGDVLLILLDHTYEAIPMFLGALYMGAVPMILPYLTPQTTPAQQGERLAGLVAFFQPRALLTNPRLQVEIDHLGVPVQTLAWEFGGDDAAAPPELTLSTRGGEETAYLQFTSGTTGQPKAVMVPHRSPLEVFAAAAQRLKLSAADVCVIAAPLSHATGLAGACLYMIWLGVRSVILAPAYWAQQPASLLHAISTYRGTYSITTNTGLNLTMLRVQPEEIAGVDLSSLRVLVVGSEMISPATLQSFAQRFAHVGFKSDAIKPGYGSSEAYIAFQDADVHWQAETVSATSLVSAKVATPVAPDSPDARQVACCGTPLRDIALQIRDEHGTVLPDRHLGEIVVQTNVLFTGYWQRPDLTAAVMKQGWYQTGDLGYLVNGELFVVGRLKDLIIVGGRNVLPDAVEEQALAAARGLVRSAVAFGVRNEEVGTEQPVVVCELVAPLDETARDQAAQAVRARVRQFLDVALADVHFVEAGWIVRAGGKLARTANREKYVAQQQTAAAPALVAEPLSTTQQVTAIFKEILGRKAIGPDENFFDLGGDSITALRMLLLVEKRLGRSVPSDFFQQPTVAYLVRLLDDATERAEAGLGGTPPELPKAPAEETGSLLQRARRFARTPHRIPQRALVRLRRPFEERAFALPYLEGVRWLAGWCGNKGVQMLFYPYQTRLFHQFCASLGASTSASQEELLCNLIGNILMQKLGHFVRSGNTEQSIREMQASSLPLIRQLGDAMAAPHDPLAQQIFAVRGAEHLANALKPGQGIVALTYHATMRHLGMGAILEQPNQQYWLSHNTYRNLFHSLYRSGSEQEMMPVARAHATQVARNILLGGGIVGIAADSTDSKSSLSTLIGDRVHSLNTGFAELALATASAVVPTYARRQPDGRVIQTILPAFDAGNDKMSHAQRVAHLTEQAGHFLTQSWGQAPGSLAWWMMEAQVQSQKAGAQTLVSSLRSPTNAIDPR